MNMHRVLATLFLLAVCLPAMTACSNTFDGVGRDLERAGETIQNTF